MNSLTIDKPRETHYFDELEALFRPRSIAVVGASSTPHSPGHWFMEGLVKIGFPGAIYPVNPKLDEVMGLKAYARLEDIPGQVDFVMSAVPASAVFDVVEGAKAKGVKLIHFFTARFSETGRADAAEAERELRRRTQEAGIRVLGPNCMGLHYPKQKITFDADLIAPPGDIGFLSQSGSHAFKVVLSGGRRGLRFSKLISYGNALDLNEADFLYHFAEDPDTRVIAAYIEGPRDGRRFFQALRYAAQRKPVVVLKGGRTAAGTAAAASHTASLAGEQRIWQVAVRQAGAVEARSINEMVDLLVAFRFAGKVRGDRAAVLGGAGGGTVEAADLCYEAGLRLPPMPLDIREEMREKLPDAWDWVGNPVDVSILGFGKRAPFSEMEILRLMAAHSDYDLVILNLPVERLLRRYDLKELPEEAIAGVRALGVDNGKALAAIVEDPEAPDESRIKGVMQAREALANGGIAVFPTLDRAAHAIGVYVRHQLQQSDGD